MDCVACYTATQGPEAKDYTCDLQGQFLVRFYNATVTLCSSCIFCIMTGTSFHVIPQLLLQELQYILFALF